MGAMNAMGWALCASASESADELWDLLVEFAERADTDGPTVHCLGNGDPRYCVHPDSRLEVEFRDDDLREALLRAAIWKAAQLDPDDVWRRG